MDSDVTISQCVVLLVTTLLSGLFATLVTLIWQDKAANKKLKYDIFVALMSNRFRLDSEKVVCALNMIDVVFNTDSKVREAYAQFCDESNKPEDGKRHLEDKFLKLLEEIARVLGLKEITWDKIKNHYYPNALAEKYNLEMSALKARAKDM